MQPWLRRSLYVAAALLLLLLVAAVWLIASFDGERVKRAASDWMRAHHARELVFDVPPGPAERTVFGRLAVLGEAGEGFLICADAASLQLIDQRAARVHLAAERLRAALRAKAIATEVLGGPGALERVARTTATLYAAREPERILANASVYLEAFGHVVLAWTWLAQALAAHGKAGDFYDGKRQACRYFFRWELPRTGAQFDLLDSLDDTTLAMRDAWF